MRTDWSALPQGYLSPSQVWQYLSCPACYEQAYIMHTPVPISADLLIGLGAHEAAADARSMLVDGAEVGDVLGSLGMMVDHGGAKMASVIEERSWVEDTGERVPVDIELTKKYGSVEEAEGMMGALVRTALPEMVAYDYEAGIDAYEARVWHLGAALPPEHRAAQADPDDFAAEAAEQADGVEPVFPFSVIGRMDVMYKTGAIKDFKTAGRRGSPDALATIQLVMYGWPWHKAGSDPALGWDVAIKTKQPGFATYWLNGSGLLLPEHWEYVRGRVVQVADDICAGRFPANEASYFHKYDHGMPVGELAVTQI